MIFPLIYPIVDIHDGLFSVVVVKTKSTGCDSWLRARGGGRLKSFWSVEKICRYLQLVMANDC